MNKIIIGLALLTSFTLSANTSENFCIGFKTANSFGSDCSSLSGERNTICSGFDYSFSGSCENAKGKEKEICKGALDAADGECDITEGLASKVCNGINDTNEDAQTEEDYSAICDTVSGDEESICKGIDRAMNTFNIARCIEE